MKTMQLQTPQPISQNPLTLTDLPRPEPGPQQIRIKVHICGVCHTDLHTVEGDLTLPQLPIVPGHQIVGTVDKVGATNGRYQVGDRVGVAWLYDTCGRCHFCQAGQENLCPQAQFTGLHANGGYAPYLIANETFTYPIPPTFTDAQAAPLLCAGIIGYRALRLSGIQPGGKLGLYGFGASAHLAIQVARHWDCQVYVFTRSQDHRHHAQALGAVWTGSAKEEPPVPLDASVTFAPAGWIVPLALGHLRPGGTVAVNAIHMSPIPQLDYNLLYGERTLRSVTNFTRDDAHAFLELAARIPIKTTVETLPLSQANTALQRLKKSQVQGAIALQP